jgi:hypothetical protein
LLELTRRLPLDFVCSTPRLFDVTMAVVSTWRCIQAVVCHDSRSRCDICLVSILTVASISTVAAPTTSASCRQSLPNAISLLKAISLPEKADARHKIHSCSKTTTTTSSGKKEVFGANFLKVEAQVLLSFTAAILV